MITLLPLLSALCLPARADALPLPTLGGGVESPADERLARAARLVLDGKLADGEALLRQVVRDDPGTAAARQAEAWLAVIEEMRRSAETTELGIERGGRLELVTTQAIAAPVLLGVLVPGTLFPEAPSPYPYVGGALLGLGVGIGGTLAATKGHDVTGGQATIVRWGELAGTSNAALVLDLSGANTGRAVFGGLALGLTAGAAGGIAAAVRARPSAGDASLVHSGGTWGAAEGVMLMLAVQYDGGDPTLYTVLPADVGAAVGALLANNLELSRGRINTINLAGYAGAVALGGVGLLVAYEADVRDPGVLIGTTGIVGSAAGLGLGTWLTRDGRELRALGAATPTVAPWVEDGRTGVVVGMSGAF